MRKHCLYYNHNKFLTTNQKNPIHKSSYLLLATTLISDIGSSDYGEVVMKSEEGVQDDGKLFDIIDSSNYGFLLLIVEENIEDLDDRFCSMIKDVREKINKRIICRDKFCDTVKEKLPLRLIALKGYINYENIQEDDVTLFFDTLDDIWDFLDYDLLRFIIRRCGDKQLKDAMSDYEQRMKTFIDKTTIHALIYNWKPRFEQDQIPEYFKECVVTLLWDPYSRTIKDLKLFLERMTKVLPQELAKAAFVLCNLKPSSVVVVWLVWEELIPLVKDRLSDFFKRRPMFCIQSSLSLLVLNGVTLYSQSLVKVRFGNL